MKRRSLSAAGLGTKIGWLHCAIFLTFLSYGCDSPRKESDLVTASSERAITREKNNDAAPRADHHLKPKQKAKSLILRGIVAATDSSQSFALLEIGENQLIQIKENGLLSNGWRLIKIEQNGVRVDTNSGIVFIQLLPTESRHSQSALPTINVVQRHSSAAIQDTTIDMTGNGNEEFRLAIAQKLASKR